MAANPSAFLPAKQIPTNQEAIFNGTGVKERALELLGNGCNAAQTAAALGVTDAYISQLLAEEDFAQAVANGRAALVEKELGRDKQWNTLEDKILEKMHDLINYVQKPGELIRMAAIANAAKRRAAGLLTQDGASDTKTQIIVLQLPAVIEQKYAVNVQGEVVEVNGRPLATINSHLLLKEVQEVSKQAIEAEAKRLEAGKEKKLNEITIDEIL